jgi:hypothetical protein
MTTIRKKITKKTGPNSRRTTTYSSTGGKTESYSNKPSKQSSRRTVSFNHNTGNRRTTYSTQLGGGYTRISSKTTSGSKPRKTPSRIAKGNVGISLSLPLLILTIPLLVIMFFLPVTIPYIIGTVVAIVAVVVIINLLIAAIPWIIFGGVLYGLYLVVKAI